MMSVKFASVPVGTQEWQCNVHMQPCANRYQTVSSIVGLPSSVLWSSVVLSMILAVNLQLCFDAPDSLQEVR